MDINKKNEFINTLKAYSYFINDDSLFFEFIDILENIDYNGTNNIPYSTLTILIKMFGGCIIRIPTIEEIKIYKMIIESIPADWIIKGRKSFNKKTLKEFIIKNVSFEIPPEVNLDEITNNMLRTFSYGRKQKKRNRD